MMKFREEFQDIKMDCKYKNLIIELYNFICSPFMMIWLETKENIFVVSSKIANVV